LRLSSIRVSIQVLDDVDLDAGLVTEVEGAMSERNGDKARFDRMRLRKLLRRKRSRELRKTMEEKSELGAAGAVPPGTEAAG
jgi:hypothetical protein